MFHIWLFYQISNEEKGSRKVSTAGADFKGAGTSSAFKDGERVSVLRAMRMRIDQDDRLRH